MAKESGNTATTDTVLDGVDLSGKRVLVTGVSARLGVETMRALVTHGAQVVGTARNLDKAQRATEIVRAAASSGAGGFELVALDLAELASVRACADVLVADGRTFDIVIANAGVMATPFGHTRDGFEIQFGTNHLGHFVFINRIAPLIVAGGRVVVLSSAGHRYADVDLDDPGFERTAYAPFTAYGRSKTANALFAVALDRRHRSRGIRATAVHPGGIRTELGRHLDPAAGMQLIRSINEDNAAAGLPPFRYKTVPQGAATTVWAATVAPADDMGGRYCEDCQVAALAKGLESSGGVQPYALDPAREELLWTLSESLVGERF